MDLKTAQGAITALRKRATFEAAYNSYAAGHDSKHRESARAYSYNHAGNSGNEPAGYYQKVKLVENPEGKIVMDVKGLDGAAPVKKSYSQDETDLSIADEKNMLFAALGKLGGFYAHPNAQRFHYAVLIPAGYAGRLFRGGGKVYPKIADQVTAMVIVVAKGRSNFQIVTHYPETVARAQAMTALT
ncbi:hypothetical protein [Sphingomonas radiodurans]|uniref:hypothetical protein n=1 Tax=Sphingomonas radiodurans TaxID=2890321 RepID=UPI001E515ACE|nr:hypothetical protein [Sphingomonas radiodurans]WBH15373.1 hypothetical protein LLW23_11015 [Sphingomonas radiodurans]